jgi:hypothetical protein
MVNVIGQQLSAQRDELLTNDIRWKRRCTVH